MKLKSYFSGTVEAAMYLARQELGEEALLVNSRPATPETRYLGAYEVVFGIPPRQMAQTSPPTSGASGQAGPTAPISDRWAEEIAGLRRDMDRMLSAFLEGRPPGSSLHPSAQTPARTAAEAPHHGVDWPPCEVDSTLGRPGA